jgi:hypothetical protein
VDSDEDPVWCGYCDAPIWSVNGIWASYYEDEYEWNCPRNDNLSHDPWARRDACRDLVRVLKATS